MVWVWVMMIWYETLNSPCLPGQDTCYNFLSRPKVGADQMLLPPKTSPSSIHTWCHMVAWPEHRSVWRHFSSAIHYFNSQVKQHNWQLFSSLFSVGLRYDQWVNDHQIMLQSLESLYSPKFPSSKSTQAVVKNTTRCETIRFSVSHWSILFIDLMARDSFTILLSLI